MITVIIAVAILTTACVIYVCLTPWGTVAKLRDMEDLNE